MEKKKLFKIILFIVRVYAAYGMLTGKTMFLKKPTNVLYKKNFITALKSLINKTGFIHITFKVSFRHTPIFLLSAQICLQNGEILRDIRPLKDEQTMDTRSFFFINDEIDYLWDYFRTTNRLTNLFYLTRLIFFLLNKFRPKINLVACIIYENKKI